MRNRGLPAPSERLIDAVGAGNSSLLKPRQEVCREGGRRPAPICQRACDPVGVQGRIAIRPQGCYGVRERSRSMTDSPPELSSTLSAMPRPRAYHACKRTMIHGEFIVIVSLRQSPVP